MSRASVEQSRGNGQANPGQFGYGRTRVNLSRELRRAEELTSSAAADHASGMVRWLADQGRSEQEIAAQVAAHPAVRKLARSRWRGNNFDALDDAAQDIAVKCLNTTWADAPNPAAKLQQVATNVVTDHQGGRRRHGAERKAVARAAEDFGLREGREPTFEERAELSRVARNEVRFAMDVHDFSAPGDTLGGTVDDFDGGDQDRCRVLVEEWMPNAMRQGARKWGGDYQKVAALCCLTQRPDLHDQFRATSIRETAATPPSEVSPFNEVFGAHMPPQVRTSIAGASDERAASTMLAEWIGENDPSTFAREHAYA